VLDVGTPQPSLEGLDARQPNCAHYKTCLTYAIDKGWDGFSCIGCRDYRRSTDELDQATSRIRASFSNSNR
jgi:hypothetical protein